MSVYKEAMHAVAEIKAAQVQIYPDAADYGVPIFSFEDKIFQALRQQKIQCARSAMPSAPEEVRQMTALMEKVTQEKEFITLIKKSTK